MIFNLVSSHIEDNKEHPMYDKHFVVNSFQISIFAY